MDDNQNNDQKSQTSTLTYEETPILEPVKEYVGTSESVSIPQSHLGDSPETKNWEKEQTPVQEVKDSKKKSFGLSFGTIGSIVGIILLFAAGVGLSLLLRKFLPGLLSQGENPVITSETTPIVINQEVRPIPASWANYPQYSVISGVTRQPIEGISFRLSPDILPPLCDGPACASQGTYLPGGTRLTVAGRGSGQILPDFRGGLVSDLAGQSFQVSQASVAGRLAVEFRGLFTGTTSGGYAFSQMHGFMIEISDKLSLEINHFTPSGVTADFVSDDMLFNDILSSVVITIPTVTTTVTNTPSVSSPTTTP